MSEEIEKIIQEQQKKNEAERAASEAQRARAAKIKAETERRAIAHVKLIHEFLLQARIGLQSELSALEATELYGEIQYSRSHKVKAQGNEYNTALVAYFTEGCKPWVIPEAWKTADFAFALHGRPQEKAVISPEFYAKGSRIPDETVVEFEIAGEFDATPVNEAFQAFVRKMLSMKKP